MAFFGIEGRNAEIVVVMVNGVVVPAIRGGEWDVLAVVAVVAAVDDGGGGGHFDAGG